MDIKYLGMILEAQSSAEPLASSYSCFGGVSSLQLWVLVCPAKLLECPMGVSSKLAEPNTWENSCSPTALATVLLLGAEQRGAGCLETAALSSGDPHETLQFPFSLLFFYIQL